MNQEKVWDILAKQWHNFRQLKFRPVYDFLERYQLKKGRILEIGCGNSRNLIPFAKLGFECYGVDFSKKMLEQSQKLSEKHDITLTLKEANMIKLPYKDNYFDYVLHISSLHHLKSEEDILKALNEAYRVLKPKGLMLLTVWNKLQLKFLMKSRELYVPWRLKGKSYGRFYHLFDYLELKRFIKKLDLEILESNILGKNLVFVLKKR
ncbi:MAG: class I SAM-dependent methyltransferase [Candidatus Woesearchaeota archaeon]